ncbi:MAG: TIR domain-containing protein [Terracidiphilus sp.]|jgi:WD40 repeat protein
MSRIFISHSSVDREQATDLLAWLRGQGFVSTFLDFDEQAGIEPGADWERTLYSELSNADAVLLILTKNWFNSKWCFVEFAQARALGKAIYPLIETPAAESLVSPDIQHLDLIKDREGGLDRLLKGLTQIALNTRGGYEWDPRRPPYPGLLAFDEADAAIYFGRDDDIRRLLERLNARRVQGGEKLVVVLGGSGSGKSSLLRAGVVPRLKRDPHNWIVLPTFRPQLQPLDELAQVVATGLRQATEWRRWRDAFNGDDFEHLLSDLARDLRAANKETEACILLVIDQGEELFTAADSKQTEQFCRVLHAFLDERLPFLAAMSLRSDYLGRLQQEPSLEAQFDEFSLKPMPLDRVREIIEGPARVAGITVEDGLVTAAIADACTEDALPLLAFAMRELYDRYATDGRLTAEAYRAMGDAQAQLSPLENAVRRKADEVLAAAKPTPEDLEALKEAFIPAMVRVNTEGEYVRRPAAMTEISPRALPLIERLAKARLLTILEVLGVTTVEVAHEALLRKWPLLRGWLDGEREFLVGKSQLEEDLLDWQSAKPEQKTDALLTGLKLTRARAWLLEKPHQLSANEREFIQASIARQEADAAQQEQARLRALRGTIALAVLVVAIVVIAVVSGQWLIGLNNEQQVAIKNYCANIEQIQQDYDSGNYASGFNILLATQPTVRLEPHAVESFLGKVPLLNHALPFIHRHPFLYALLNGFDMKADGGFEWNYLLARSFGDSALAYAGHTNEVRGVAISPDGKWLATAGADSTVRIFDISQVNNCNSRVTCLDRALLVLDSNGDARPIERQNLQDGDVNAQLVAALGKRSVSSLPGAMSVQFSPDGKWIAIGVGNWSQAQIAGTVYLWSTEEPGKVMQLTTGIQLKTGVELKFQKAVDSVVFKKQADSAGAWELAATSDDNSAEFWSIAPDGKVAYKGNFDASAKAAKGMNAAAYSPDGKTFAMIFGDGHLWIQESQQPWQQGCSEPFVADVSGLMSMAFYDNDEILLGTRDGSVIKVDLPAAPSQRDCTKQLEPSSFLVTGQGLVTSLAISADKDFLVTTGSSGVLLVWKLVRDVDAPFKLLEHGESVMLRGHRDGIYSAAITPDERLIVSGGANAQTGGSSNTTGGPLVTTPGSRVCFWELQPGPDGNLPLGANQTPATPSLKQSPIIPASKLANITWASQPAKIQADGAVQALGFSPDGRELASLRGFSRNIATDQPTEIYFTPLDPKTRKPTAAFSPFVKGHNAPGTSLAWSADGKFVVTAAMDGTVLLWDVAKQTSVALEVPKDNENHPIPTMDLCFSRDGWLVGTAAGTVDVFRDFTWKQKTYSTANSLLLWKPEESAAIQKVVALPNVQAGGVFSPQQLAFSAGGDRLAACGLDNADSFVKVQIWDTNSLLNASPGSPEKTLSGSEFPKSHEHPGDLHSECTAVTFSPDGEWLAVGTYSHEIAVWSTANWGRVEGEFALSGSVAGSKAAVRGRYLDSPPKANAVVNSIAFSPDNMRLAYGTADGNIYIWGVMASLPVITIDVHTGEVLALAFSPDGRCLASGSSDQTVIFSCEADQGFLSLRRQIAASQQYIGKVAPEATNWTPYAQ